MSRHLFNYPDGMRKTEPETVSLEDLAADADETYVFTDHEDEHE
jgi:hypothetical protein